MPSDSLSLGPFLTMTVLLLAASLAYPPTAQAQSIPGMSNQPVEAIDNRLLPAPGEENREFAVEELQGARVSLGGPEPVGVVEAVVQGLEEQISFVVATNDRFGGRRVLLPISDTVVRDDTLLPGYSLTQLRALPTLTEAAAANLAPLAANVAIRLRVSELDRASEPDLTSR